LDSRENVKCLRANYRIVTTTHSTLEKRHVCEGLSLGIHRKWWKRGKRTLRLRAMPCIML